jgi:uncharacterized protein
VLLDDAWCAYFKEHNFLIGLSVDGPQEIHDAYRLNKGGQGTFKQVMRGWEHLRKHGVDFNILCTVNAANQHHGREVYRFFRDELKTPFLQFIPIVEVDPENGQVTDRSVSPEQYGRFLMEIFDEWVQRDVGSMYVLFFDGVLASYLRGQSSLCILRPTCGDGVALEHNGDVYSCDHFVEPEHLLGNIMQTPIGDLVDSEKQAHFGQIKQGSLPKYCRQCRFLFTCHGECPKNRLVSTPDGEPGLNWLCPGLKAFFEHTERPMQIMAELLRRGRPASDIMKLSSLMSSK